MLKLVLNILILACSQNDSCWNHIHIIPAPVKDFFEKGPDEIPSGTAVKFHRTYSTVISGCHFYCCYIGKTFSFGLVLKENLLRASLLYVILQF